MSVLQYTYPRTTKSLHLAVLLPALGKIRGVAVVQCEGKPRSSPDWASLTISHPNQASIRSLFVVEKNTLSDRDEHPRNAKLLAIKRAAICIWSQLLLPPSAPDRSVSKAIRVHYSLLTVIA